MISQEKLDFWINNNYNVLFVGKHGVGKTSIVKDAFERAGLKWMYFSASTMDPWVDMVGVPKEKKLEDGSSYLDLVRPKEFQNDEVQALFFDEFNRSHKKIRNAVMELIQFKSINGKKFNNLKLIWAAINPDDEDEYDVEKLDPAQEDRFHIKIDIPYKPEASYFNKVYGKEMSKGALAWWKELPQNQKDLVSPRRLDYALDIFSKKGDMRDALPANSNVSKLISSIEEGPISERLSKFIKNNSIEEARIFLKAENNFSSAYPLFLKNKNFMTFFVPLISNEKLVLLMSKNNNIIKYVLENCEDISHYKEVIINIVNAKQSKSLIKKINRFNKNKINFKPKASIQQPIEPYFTENRPTNFLIEVEDAVKTVSNKRYCNATQRKTIWNNLINKGIPKDLTLLEARTLLNLCDKISRDSQLRTIEQLKHFYGTLNYALIIFTSQSDGKISWNQFCKMYRDIVYKMNTYPYFNSKVNHAIFK